MDSLFNDLRFAVRSLMRSRSFTIAAVLALGLGTGSAAGVFSLLDGVVLRPLPYSHPDRLVSLWEVNLSKGLEHEPISPVNFGDYRALHGPIEDAVAWWRPELNLTGENGDAIRVSVVETSENLFDVLGVKPFIGTDFPVHPGLFGSEHDAMISYRLWQSRFGGEKAVLGKGIRLNGSLYTIVGVMPPGFNFPGETDLWQQLRWDMTQHSRGAHFMESVARLRSGVTAERLNQDLATLTKRLGTDFVPTNAGWGAHAVPLDHEVAGAFRPALFALFGAAGLLLAIACINVANLLLARAASRRREIALRAAIGASRTRLIRLFLTESAVLAAAGAVVGLIVAALSVKGLLAWTPIHIPRAEGVHVNATVLVFATLIAAGTALAFGLVPALLMSQADLQDALKDGGKGSGSHGTKVRRALVVAEVALAVVLLTGAGLVVRSVKHLLQVNTGVDAASVVAADIQLPDAGYDWTRVNLFYTSLVQALDAHSEVVSAGASNFLPLDPGWRLPFLVAGAAPVPSGDEPTAQFHSVDAGYFSTLRVSVVRGRAFDAHDDSASRAVVIVNETLAKQLWPNTDPIGKQLVITNRGIGPLGFRIVPGNEHEVVGVVSDVKNTSLKGSAEPAIFFSTQQFPFLKMYLVVRGRGDAAPLSALIREEVRRLDPAIPLGDIKRMDRVLAASVDPPRFVLLLLSVFAARALTLAGVGIYGILSYMVSYRRREFGIRLALGAQPAMVLRMIVREGLGLAIGGCVLGVCGAYLAGRSLSGFLFDVAPWDPATLASVLIVVLGVAVAACLIPGQRASAEDPAGALRAE